MVSFVSCKFLGVESLGCNITSMTYKAFNLLSLSMILAVGFM
jgi:hypothetical protein